MSAGNISIAFSGPGGADVLTVDQTLANLHHIVWGTNRTYLLILKTELGVGNQVSYLATLIDLVTPGLPSVNVITTPLKQSFSAPTVSVSGGPGDAFFCFVTDQDDQTYGLGIYRSASGEAFFPVVPPSPTENVFSARATATDLEILYQGAVYASGPIPKGSLKVSPGALHFPDVAVGGCPQPAVEKNFDLENDGGDCLQISQISGSAHFQFVAASLPLPAFIAPGDTVSATIRFVPGAVPNNFDETVTIVRVPAVGESSIDCDGEAVAAVPDINISSTTLNFGKVAAGSSHTKSFTIRNDGTASGTASVAGPAGAIPFSWTPPADTNYNCGETHTVQVTFAAPNIEDTFTHDVTITSSDPSAPGQVHLVAEVCIPEAGVTMPALFPVHGNVEKGFRALRMVKVTNTGDGLLTFQGVISGPDAALFGMMTESGSITDTVGSRSYDAEPIALCGGGAGVGFKQVAVVFFANTNDPLPRNCSATLTLSNFNVPGQPDQVYNLSATIIAAVKVDCVAVIDRSGSMDDAVPGGTKMSAAIKAAQLLPQLLPPDLDHRFGAVRFNATADAFLPIGALTSANQLAKIGAISPANLDPDGSTSIVAGTATGLDQVNSAPLGERRCLVILSDGKDNRAWQDPDSGDWFSILGGMSKRPDNSQPIDTAQFPLPADVRIYTIALGQDADIDKAALAHLAGATEATYHALNPNDQETLYQLMKLYTLIYMDIVGTVPITDPVFVIQPGETYRIPFDLLRGDVGAIAVLYDLEGIRLPFWLESPTGEIVDASYLPVGYQTRSGFSTATRHLEFKVPLGEPDRYAGQWTVMIQHQGKACTGTPQTGPNAPVGFVPRKCKDKFNKPVKFGLAIGAGSNFRMQPYVSPEDIYVGDRVWLDAVITEAGLQVTGCDVEVTAFSPGGSQWDLSLKDTGLTNDGDASDGEYAEYFKYTSQPGTYNFHFRATGLSRDGEPVVREAWRSKYVKSKNGEPGVPPDRPGGGGSDECCKLLLREMRKHTALLQKIAEKKQPAKKR